MKFEFAQCQLLALSGHSKRGRECPLLGGKADMTSASQMSAYNPKPTSDFVLSVQYGEC
jgi:hypothetical protein